jgi:hypothetical protein
MVQYSTVQYSMVQYSTVWYLYHRGISARSETLHLSEGEHAVSCGLSLLYGGEGGRGDENGGGGEEKGREGEEVGGEKGREVKEGTGDEGREVEEYEVWKNDILASANKVSLYNKYSEFFVALDTVKRRHLKVTVE